MHMDPQLPVVVAVAAAIVALGLILRRLGQPHVVAYLAAGAILGPHGFALVTETETLTRVGDIGVVMLLFFVGMEVSFARVIANWRVAVIGTFLQIAVSVGSVWVLGALFDWPAARIVLMGFVISLSSTAVVISIVRQWGAFESEMGSDAIGILIVQDLALIPMLVTIGLMSEARPHAADVVLQLVGGGLMIGLVATIIRRGTISLPFASWIEEDHELQVFVALLLCLGFATFTGYFRVSAALGAFVAGFVVASARQTDWVSRALEPLRVVFVSLFFVSIGMLIDFDFLQEYALVLALTVLAVLLTNTFVNSSIVRVLGRDWGHAIFTGAILAQIGELSFVLVSLGLSVGIIGGFTYQLTVATISLSLLVSPAWIALVRRSLRGVSDLPGGHDPVVKSASSRGQA